MALRFRRSIPALFASVGFGSALVAAVSLAQPATAGGPDAHVVLPMVADPFDTVRIVGTGLAGVDEVEFTAIVGGFVGVWTMSVAPLSVSDTEVVVVVPHFNSFSPPEATPPGDPIGSVRLIAGGTPSQDVAFGYLEATFGAIQTLGQGGSQPAGFEPRSGLDITPPPGPFAVIRPMVSGAPEGDIAVLGIGLPASPPYIPLFGGSLYLDVVTPPIVAVVGVTGEHGVATAAVPHPGVLGLTAAFQWFTVDPAGAQTSASDVLHFQL